MERLGAALDAQLRERRRQCALQAPGEKVETGLHMSQELLAHFGLPEKAPLTLNLSALWRALQGEESSRAGRS